MTDSLPHSQHAYAAFGRTVVADRAIPFPDATQVSGQAIEVSESAERCNAGPSKFALVLHEIEDFRDGPRLRVLRDGPIWWIDYLGCRFRMSPASNTIEYCEWETVRAGIGFERLIERVVLPLFLLFESSTTLGVHGGSVVVGDRAWIFIGDSGAGKSTTARVLVERGAMLLADDLTLIDQANLVVLPGCPAVRLWEEQGAVELAIEDHPESTYREKRWFRFPAACAASTPAPVGGLIVLSPHAPDTPITEPTIQRLVGHEAFAALMAQTFDISHPEPEWSRRRFRSVAELARTHPIYRYSFARSSSGEPTHVEALEEFIVTSDRELTP